MIKRIWFPIAGLSSVESGLSAALTIAVENNAHLDVIYYRRPFNTEINLSVNDYDTVRLVNGAKEFDKLEKKRALDAPQQFNQLTENREAP
jgi:hypothetical protein